MYGPLWKSTWKNQVGHGCARMATIVKIAVMRKQQAECKMPFVTVGIMTLISLAIVIRDRSSL